MEITERRIHDIVVLDLTGRISISDGGAQRLREKVTALCFDGNWKVMVNLAGVPHIDSSSLGEMVSILTATRRMRATLKLFGLTHRVIELLTITKLVTEFETYVTEQEALESFLVTA